MFKHNDKVLNSPAVNVGDMGENKTAVNTVNVLYLA